MKNILKLLSILFAVALFSLPSCSDEFLDVDPQTSLSTEMAIGAVADAEVALMGIYDGMQSTQNYYAREFVVIPDVAGDDVKISPLNSGRFLSHYNYSTIPSDGFLTGFWNRAWNTIDRANNIITRIDLIEDGTEAERNQILGEALTLRALAHFDLARMYAKSYAEDPSALCIPYMEEPAITDPERETNQVVYDKIVSDLTRAIPLLTIERAEGGWAYISEYAAKALLARVYLYMENWDMAASTAIDVIDNGGYSLVSTENYISGWSEEATSETIFSLAMSNVDYSATNALGYIYVERGYGDLLPTDDIISLLENAGNTDPGDDVRFDAFLIWEEGKEDWFINKYPGRGGQAGLDNTPVLRLSEMYLIAAEALAKKATPDENQAQTYLNAIIQRGNPDAADFVASGENLIERINLEKRIEFAFEGHRLFDIKRRKEDLIRGADCTADICFLEAGHNRLAFPIPQREMDANPNMQQNPGY
ncbi:MAG: RagB/SusD family nutrient uptake outer membrane protein [bacterium]